MASGSKKKRKKEEGEKKEKEKEKEKEEKKKKKKGFPVKKSYLKVPFMKTFAEKRSTIGTLLQNPVYETPPPQTYWFSWVISSDNLHFKLFYK
jgi:hypothetical protein